MRYQYVELEILRGVLQFSDNHGYNVALPTLCALLQQTIPDLTSAEVVDALKRLGPRYLTLWKWGDQWHPRPVEYGGETDDAEFFYRGDILLRKTPDTDVRAQELDAALFVPSEAKKTYGFRP